MLKILGRTTSANVQKVTWCCAELGLAFERQDVGGPFGRNRDPEYLAMNPNGLVPTIINDGFALWKSNTIVRYLASVHGGDEFWPSDPRTRADVERWMDWQLSVLAPAIYPVFWGLIRTKPEDRDMNSINAGRDRLAAAFAILDRHLAGRDYVGGANFAAADIPIGVIAYRWFEMDIKREDYPDLKKWHDRLGQRSGFREHVMTGLA